MKPKIINRCINLNCSHAEKVVKGVISKIPDKFLEGINSIDLLDNSDIADPICKYISNEKSRKIEIYLENPILHKIPFISALSLDIYLILSINKHIDNYLKPRSKDQEILLINPTRINYNWMHFSPWNPFYVILKILNLFVKRVKSLKRV